LQVAAAATEVDDDVVIEGRSLRQIAWRRFKRDRVALVAGVVLIIILLVAIFASQLIEWYGQPPSQFNSDLISNDTTMPVGSFGGISTRHWLGIEPVNGRDMLSRLIAGLRTSMIIALPATGISVVLGVLTGVLAGYYRGALDAIMVLFYDVLLSLPGLLSVVALVAILNQA